MFKTSLLKYLKICMDLSVASCLHGIKITAEQGLKSSTLRSLVCMLVLVTTLITKIHGKHLCKEDMARHQPHRMHTSIMAKMTKELVLLIDSRQHYEALLQRWFRHQDELEWTWCNRTKWSTRWDEQFDILHAWNGATDAEIHCDDHGMIM